MWLDALALVLLGIFTLMGAQRGALASGLSLFTLAAAYAGAILLGPSVGAGVAESFDVPAFLGAPIGGAVVFLAVFVAMAMVSYTLRSVERSRRAGRPRARWNRALGGAFGATRGAVIVLLLGWLALWVDALRVSGAVSNLPETGSSSLAAVTASVVETGVGAALADSGPAGRVAARVAARPALAVEQVQRVIDHPRIDELREDRAFWVYVESGAVDAAMNRTSFLRITYDDALRSDLALLGLVDSAAADDTLAFRLALGEVLREVGPRIRGLSSDPQVRQLLEDPEVVQLVQWGDTLALLRHPGFQRVVSRVMAERSSEI